MTTLMVPPSPRPPRRRRRARWAAAAVVMVVAALVWPSVSLVDALTYPGDASVSVRIVDWVRDHGGGGLVDTVENWWFARPPTAPLDPVALPSPPSPAVPPTPGAATPPGPTGPTPAPPPEPLAVAPRVTPAPGEGRWVAGVAAPDRTPAVYTTFERPDPRHPGVVAGVARLDGTRTRARLIGGTREPDRTAGPDGARVPDSLLPTLVATFNSGFKIKDAHGGYLADGRTAVPLRDGAASFVVRGDGTATVGAWGRDVVGGPDVVAVRQNLDLVVDGGHPVEGLGTNSTGRWGTAKNQLQYTWRSAVGVDAAGNLLYVAGADMNLTMLADALVQAGVIRGMELDIHPEMVHLFTYHPGADGTPVGTKLLPAMLGRNDRYLVPDQRDFLAVTLR